ncbi:MAG: 2-amino-4-hydroxy-6-hydroxymethyldihydropteridine diphosphokinase, partial [Candidatus Rokuibacteriota bacterium]
MTGSRCGSRESGVSGIRSSRSDRPAGWRQSAAAGRTARPWVEGGTRRALLRFSWRNREEHVARVFLSVGSNLGDRLECLRRAVAELRAMSGVEFLDASALYRTEPWEQRPGQQPDEDTWFFNCAVSIETTLDPMALLVRVQEVEQKLGRRRGPGTP